MARKRGVVFELIQLVGIWRDGIKIIFVCPKPEKARHKWEKLVFYACGFRSSKTFSNEKSELVQPFLHCSAIIFELISPIQTQKNILSLIK